jgi:hypothetical protein
VIRIIQVLSYTLYRFYKKTYRFLYRTYRNLVYNREIRQEDRQMNPKKKPKKLKKLRILNVEIIDHNKKIFNPTAISISIEILLYSMIFTIEYHIHDSNGISLKPQKSSVEYQTIQSICTMHNIQFNYLLDTIKEQTKAQEEWNQYVKENYPSKYKKYKLN